MQRANKAVHEKAMIIEDEKDLSYLLAIVLKKNNVTPSCAYSIREASQSIKNINPSIIFLDNHLPDGMGSDFIAKARAANPSAKIIMMTAHDAPGDIEDAYHRGADYFIHKPFTSSTIEQTLGLVHRS